MLWILYGLSQTKLHFKVFILLIFDIDIFRNDGWLLGDSAYALKKYMMTPKSNPSDQGEENYNAAHSRTRVVVERALGVCKSRFRYLYRYRLLK